MLPSVLLFLVHPPSRRLGNILQERLKNNAKNVHDTEFWGGGHHLVGKGGTVKGCEIKAR